jgi:hypothetical protein
MNMSKLFYGLSTAAVCNGDMRQFAPLMDAASRVDVDKHTGLK